MNLISKAAAKVCTPSSDLQSLYGDKQIIIRHAAFSELMVKTVPVKLLVFTGQTMRTILVSKWH